MSAIGLVLPDEFSKFSLAQTIEFAERADTAGFHSVWKQEASGSNSVATLGAIAQRTRDVRLGTGIASVYSRTPALLGMSAVTLDHLSDGRAILGVGISSPPLVERWHGMEFDRPLARLREAIEIIRNVTAGGAVEYHGDVFDVGPYTMALDPVGDVPLFNAAIGETNRRLTAEFGDGWLPAFVPQSSVHEQVADIRESARAAGRDPDDITIAPWVPTAVDPDPDRAEHRVRYLLAQEMAMGYNEQVGRYDFGDAPDIANEKFLAGDRDGAVDAITAEMLDELTIYGTATDVDQQLNDYYSAGVDIVIAMPSMAASESEVEYLIDTLGQPS